MTCQCSYLPLQPVKSVSDTFFIFELFAGKASDKDITLAEIETKKGKMLTDLNNLIRCFEIYLEDLVKNIDISQLSLDIYNLNIDKILSFNYTNTYQKLYDPN